MGSSSKPQTIGYKYLLGLHAILTHGPADDLSRFTVDERTAWSGTSAGGQVIVNAPDLFGGDSREGGVSGTFDLEMGLPTQNENVYLQSQLGTDIPAFRGVVGVVMNQMYLGNNPYLKKFAFRLKRIHLAQDGVEQWYDEKAEIGYVAPVPGSTIRFAAGFGSTINTPLFGDGATMSAAATPLASRDKVIAGYPAPRLYAFSSNAASFTDDYGATWTDCVFPAGWTGCAEVCHNGSGIMYARGQYTSAPAGNPGIVKCIDGINFIPVASAGIPAYPNSHGLGAVGDVLVFGGEYDKCFYYSTNQGASFAWGGLVIAPYQGLMSFMYNGTLFAGGSDGHIYAGPATGPLNSVFGSGAQFRGIVDCGDGIIVACCTNGDIYRSTVGGLSGWAYVTNVGHTIAANYQHTLAFVDGRLLLACQSLTKYSDDYGNTWSNTTTTSSDTRTVAAIPTLFTPGIEGEGDMNPAHIIRECLTDSNWGMGYSPVDIDDVSFMAAADTLFDEEFGLSLLWDKQMPLEQFINEIIKHIDAALYVDRKSGKFTLKLIRGGYDLGSLPEFDESNIDKIKDFSRREIGDLVNSVTVNYWDKVTGKPASVTATDPALVQQQGAVVNTTVQYPGVTTAALANRLALRDLRALSTPLVSFTSYVDWDGRDINIGDVVKVSWNDYGFVALPIRVTGLAFGDGVSNKIKLTCSQDVYELPIYGIITSPDSLWEDPVVAPIAVEREYAEELPYYELIQQASQSLVDSQLETDTNIGRVGAAASRPQSSAINARFMTDGGLGYIDIGAVDFSPSALLDVAVDKVETEWTLKDGVDLGSVTLGTYAKIGDEYVIVANLVGLVLTVQRGTLDTVPQEHAEDDVVYFSDPFMQASPIEYVTSDMVNVKLLTTSGAGVLPIASASAMLVEFDGRAARPYPPGQFTIQGVSYPTDAFDEISVGAVDRNRVVQSDTLVGTEDGAVAAEVGTTYTIRYYADDVLEHTETGITTFPSTYTPVGDCLLRIELEAVRDGLVSWQFHSHELPYTTLETTYRITEAGELRLTEDDDYRITE